MAIFGLVLVMVTETIIRAITTNPKMMVPHSWWLMSGYMVAAAYCILLHWFLKIRDTKRGFVSEQSRHSLYGIPLGYWSILYILFGLLRVYSPK